MPRTGHAGLIAGEPQTRLDREGDRIGQLGTALVRMARDLTDARRRAKALERENAELRRRACDCGGEHG